MNAAAQVGFCVLYTGSQVALKVYETRAMREFRIQQEELRRQYEESMMERLRTWQTEHNTAMAEAQQQSDERHRNAINDRDARFAEMRKQIDKIQTDYDETMKELRREYDEKIEERNREVAEKTERNALAHNQHLEHLNEQQKIEKAEADRALETCKVEHAEEVRLLNEETERFEKERKETVDSLMKEMEKQIEDFDRKNKTLHRENEKLSILAAEERRSHLVAENELRNQMISETISTVKNTLTLAANEDYCKKYQDILKPIDDITSAISAAESCYKKAKYKTSLIKPGSISVFDQDMKTGIQEWKYKRNEFYRYSISASNVPANIRCSLMEITDDIGKMINSFDISEMEIMSTAYDIGDLDKMESQIKLLKGFKANLINAKSEYRQISLKITEDSTALPPKMPQMKLEEKVGSELENPE
ncbi:hypothetical protein GCK72_019950 [Caenorhabditis remanei]|uniref:Uncharacterized protein n=1 Tax=Caenorhabditis remanei TaxID=31234 RepID=A0A6A5GFF1_CAERE|nr:hypothetical protein GCK72_019950 [Caenorhabditis remanei]KAF1753393.1 hypothetical protein GCK72_019950 [Caenorhabditis remanei]